MLKKQLSSHSFGLQMDGKTINKRQEALSRLQTVGCWDYHNTRETKRARVNTRVKRRKERVSRLFRVFSTCEEKKTTQTCIW